MRKILAAIDFVHRSGFCHNSISSDSIWLTTTNQDNIATLDVRLTDLGAAQRLADLDRYAREGVVEDLYQIGFVFLELVTASMSEDAGEQAAIRARLRYLSSQVDAAEGPLGAMVERFNKASTQGQGVRTGALTHKEWQLLFETHCDSDFQALRDVLRAVAPEASEQLEANSGEAFKLILKLLARGRLVDPVDGKPLPLSGRGLIREFAFLKD
jgi:hypothetical protein